MRPSPPQRMRTDPGPGFVRPEVFPRDAARRGRVPVGEREGGGEAAGDLRARALEKWCPVDRSVISSGRLSVITPNGGISDPLLVCSVTVCLLVQACSDPCRRICEPYHRRVARR